MALGGSSSSDSITDQSQNVMDQSGALAATAIKSGNKSKIMASDYSDNEGFILGDLDIKGDGNALAITMSDMGAIEGGLSLAGKALDTGFAFGESSLYLAQQVSESAMQTVAGLSAKQSEQQRELLGEQSRLAESLASGGESRTREIMKTMVIGAVVLGVAAVAAYAWGKR